MNAATPTGADGHLAVAGDALGPRLANSIVVLCGLAVALAAVYDQWLYFSLGAAGIMFAVAAFQQPYIGLLCWMFAFPILDPYLRLDLPAGIPDVTLNRIAVALMAVPMMVAVMLRRRRLLAIGPTEGRMLLLCGIMLGDIYIRSESSGEDVLPFFDEYATPFLLFFVFKNMVASGTDVRKALLALALSCVYLAPFGAFQFLFHSDPPGWIGPPDTVHSLVEEQGRARGPFTDSVSYGALGNVVFLSCIFLFAWSRAMSSRLFYGALLVGTGSIVFLCMTRSVWLGLLVALLLAAYHERRLRRVVLALLLSGAIGVAGFLAISNEGAESVTERAGDYETVYIRLALYNAAVTMAVQQPFIGYGRHATELFQKHRAKYVSDFFGIGAEWGILAGPPHNAVISMTLMYGVFGAAVYISIFVSLIRSFLALRRAKGALPLPPTAYGTFMLAMSVIYISIGMFTDVMAFPFFSNLYFTLAGGAQGLRIYLARQAATRAVPTADQQATPASALARAV
ncbi:MAG: O-antigen ligase family protein [Proteobacteria bacterium]|nr:O-antigen ligase family protein [Pseudomonadota bacterium]